jgi:hypothetical protein
VTKHQRPIKRCPKCGYVFSKRQGKPRLSASWLIILLAFAVVLWAMLTIAAQGKLETPLPQSFGTALLLL